MREILFRGKRLDNGEWVYGDVQHNYDHDPRCISDYCGSSPVDPSTVGQYTGLQDKNGKRIFEGDILRYGLRHDYACFLESLERPDDYDGEVYDQDIEISAVEWCGKEYDYPAFDLKDHMFECNGLAQLMNGDYEREIIGNIHDNPELLEGGSNG